MRTCALMDVRSQSYPLFPFTAISQQFVNHEYCHSLIRLAFHILFLDHPLRNDSATIESAKRALGDSFFRIDHVQPNISIVHPYILRADFGQALIEGFIELNARIRIVKYEQSGSTPFPAIYLGPEINETTMSALILLNSSLNLKPFESAIINAFFGETPDVFLRTALASFNYPDLGGSEPCMSIAASINESNIFRASFILHTSNGILKIFPRSGM